MEVEYRQIAGLNGYRFGDDGSVWTQYLRGCRSGKIGDWRQVTQYVNSSGHLFVRLIGLGPKSYVHRLILQAFVGIAPDGMECLHRDGDPTNNRLSNLRWGTRGENCADTARHGRAHRGDRHRLSKLREEDIPEILRLKNDRPNLTSKDLGVLFGVNEATIRAVLSGRNWSWISGKTA